MKLPIITNNTLDDSKREEFINYMEILQDKVDISKIDEDITGIYTTDCNKINVIPMENSVLLQYFRDDYMNPIREEIVINDQIFLCLKNSGDNEINVNIGSVWIRYL